MGACLGLVIAEEAAFDCGDCQCFSVGSSSSPAVEGPVEVGSGSG